MPERVPPAFLQVLADLTGWLESARVPAMIIGGVAASILGRPRATRDIEGLLDAHPTADVERARRWIREFATAMTTPDLLDGFDKLLAQRKSKQTP
jgi:hypothetical protein